MAGVYLNDNDVFTAFSVWLNDSLRLKGNNHPITAHVSSFIESDLSNDELLGHSIKEFLELVSCVVENSISNEWMPMLVVPLGYSDNMCFWNGSEPLSSQMSDEPPSICLVEKDKLICLKELKNTKLLLTWLLMRLNPES